jgi:CRP-like cAMP-binding protein
MNVEYLLSNITKKISLTTEEQAFFIGLLKSKKIIKGDFLLREGEVCKYETFITDGCLIAYYQDENGLQHITDFLIEGWWANDLYSLFTQTPSKFYIKAIEESEVLQISKTNLELLYKQISTFERFFRLLYQHAFIAQQEQINLTLSATAEERYKLFTKKKPYAEKRFSQKDIASYLGITPQFLSVLKKKLRQVNVD